MCKFILMVWGLSLTASAALGGSIPERATIEVLGPPSSGWFTNLSSDGAYLFDAETGDMLGMLSVSSFTPAIAVSTTRGEAYAAESYLSRGSTGEREDIFSIYSTTTLASVFEIDVPDKISELKLAVQIGLLDDDRHVVYYNMTPAQSVGVIDLGSRTHVAEISTPGCAMILPVRDRAFLMLCGDGSAQFISLNEDGTEKNRLRNAPFFSVQDDAIFDAPARLDDGWLLVSHQGHVYTIGVDGDQITVSVPWLLSGGAAENAGWRPGGEGTIAVNRDLNRGYVLMHEGGVDTHHEPGTELWVFDIRKEELLARWALKEPWSYVLALQTDSRLIVGASDSDTLEIHDGETGEHVRTIAEPGRGMNVLQEFSTND